MKLPLSLTLAINEFSKIPGIGPKSAQRHVLHLLKQNQLQREQLAAAIAELERDIMYCEICHNMTDRSPCAICSDLARNRQIICVVEEPFDAFALDKTGQFSGLFHILGGVLNPLEGIGPEQLHIHSLIKRIETTGVTEIIIATNPSLEGETTAMHLAKILNPLGISVTRIAHGLPMGGDLEYADDLTLSKALQGRRAL